MIFRGLFSFATIFNLFTLITAPPQGSGMNLKKTGAVLCKGGMIARGAPVDPECAANIKGQLEVFSSVKFQEARCENGKCIVEYKEKGILAYVCEAEAINNARIEGHCKITAPPGAHIKFSPESTCATLKTFIREDLYY